MTANGGSERPLGISFLMESGVEVRDVEAEFKKVINDLSGLLMVVLMIFTDDDVNHKRNELLSSWDEISHESGVGVVVGVGTFDNWEYARQLASAWNQRQSRSQSTRWMICADIGSFGRRLSRQDGYERMMHLVPSFLATRGGGPTGVGREKEVILPIVITEYDGDVSNLQGASGVIDDLYLATSIRGSTLAPSLNNPKKLDDVLKALGEIPSTTEHLMIHWSGHGRASLSEDSKLITASGQVTDGITLGQIIEGVKEAKNLSDLLTLTIIVDVCFGKKLTVDLKVSRDLFVFGSSRMDQKSVDDGEYSCTLSRRMIRDAGLEWRELMTSLGEESEGWKHSSTQLIQQGFSWPPEQASLAKIDSKVFIADKTRDFVGRKRLFKETEEWRLNGPEQVLIVKGDPGIGKSAWAASLVSNEQWNNHVAASHLCRYDHPVSLQGGAWLENVAAQLIEWAESSGLTPSDDCVKAVLERGTEPVKDAWKKFLSVFKSSVEGKGPPVSPVLIVIDSLDEAVDVGGSDGTQILEAVAGSVGDGWMPSWLKVVTTSRDDPLVLSKIESSLPGMKEIKSSDTDNLSDLREYVVAQMGDDARERDIEAVVSAADGNFMYAVQLLRHGVAGENLEEMLREGGVPKGLQGLYSAMMKRLFPSKEEFVEVLAVFNVLAAAKAAVPRGVFDGAMKAAGLKEGAVKLLLDNFSSVLEVSDVVVRIYHKSFGDWLVETGYREGRRQVVVDLKEGHDLLAKGCASLWPGERGSYVDTYMCVHAVEGSGGGLEDVIGAIGGVDAEAGEWYEYYYRKEGARKRYRLTLIWMACEVGNLEVAQRLVNDFRCGVDHPNKYGRTPLYVASRNGHHDVVRFLLLEGQSGAVDAASKDGTTPLYAASANGHHDVVRFLLLDGHSRAVDTANKYGARTPLFAASRYGHVEVVRFLLLEGQSRAVDTADAYGENPLNVASRNGHIEVVRLLLLEGQSRALDTVNRYGWTPLWIALEHGHQDVVDFLLPFSSLREDPAVLLVYSVMFSSTDELESFLKRPGYQDVNKYKDPRGNTALMYAARAGRSEALTLLIAAGSDANHVNLSELSALHEAVDWGHLECVSGLLDAGADPNLLQHNRLLEFAHTSEIRELLKSYIKP